MAFDLERFVRLARLEQIETCGPNDPAMLAAMPAANTQYYPDGTRAIIHIEDAPTNDDSLEPQGHIAALKNQHDFIQYLVVPKNGFRAISVHHAPMGRAGVSSQRPAQASRGRVYAVEGEGYTESRANACPGKPATCSTCRRRCGSTST